LNFEDVKTKLLEKLPSDDLTKLPFQAEIQSASLVRTVMHRINGRINDRDALITYNSRRIHVEHIAPEGVTDLWIDKLFPGQSREDNISEYSAVVENWGNKTLLDRTINMRIKQKSFEIKRDGDGDWPGYKNSTIAITKDLVNVLDWTVEEIKLRNGWVADCFLKIWSPDPQEHELINYSEFRQIDR
jgi:hypothetical protein